MFAVVVTLTVSPDSEKQFMPLMRANAKTSLNEEEGCHRFDIATDPTRPGDVLLYELYADRTAFEAHLESAHFRAFDLATSKMIQGKSVKTYGEVVQ